MDVKSISGSMAKDKETIMYQDDDSKQAGLSEHPTFVSDLVYDKNSLMMQRTHSNLSLSKRAIDIKSFTIERLIGRGSYAKVFQVTKNDTGQIFAMKVLKKSKMENNKDVTRVFNEKDIIKNIDHPHVIKLHYTFQTRTKAYFVLDYLNGGDLYTQMMIRGRLKESHCKFYIAEILLALECLHNNKVVYRDLKPQNIILDADGHIKLTDFGLSKQNFDADQENSI